MKKAVTEAMIEALREADDEGGEIFYKSPQSKEGNHYILLSDLPRVYEIMRAKERKRP